jgi:diguanylate cyclase (GGDEF)-like protein/PAS domain S-box-containing protein
LQAVIRNPVYEQQRIDALHRSALLDTPNEPEFDELVEIAAAICGASMSLVSLVDTDRQWFKASVGMDTRETSREVSFCAHVIADEEPHLMTVPDATHDPRFSDNPLVTGDMGLRFYAGVPVHSPDGFPLGTLCVLDRVPRQLTDTQKSALETLARQINARIELRQQRIELRRALEAAEKARAKLAAADRRFNAFMNSGPFVSYLKDPDGRFVAYNQPFAERFGVSLRDWLGKTNHQVFPQEFADVFRAHDIEVLKTERTTITMEETVNTDGSKTCWRSYKFPCPSDDGINLLGGISIDVTEEVAREDELRRSKVELEKANELLRELATTDPLTGLPNRRVFTERLELEFNRSRRKKLALSVMMLDIDDFKKLNDSYGHDAGDRALVHFADILRNIVRESDLAARYGGEEFIVLLPECDEAQSVGFAERLLEAVRSTPWADGPVFASIGIAALTGATPDAARLVTLADEALYAAKRAGKNCVIGYGAYYQKILEGLRNPDSAV